MARASLFIALLLTLAFIEMRSQDAPLPHLTPGAARKAVPPLNDTVQSAALQTVSLTVPKGTPLQLALDQEVRVKEVGQPVHGRVVEAAYVFDRLVIPIGAEMNGHLTRIETTSGRTRVLAALNADFSPQRKVEIVFDELVLPDGRHFLLHTHVAEGSGQVIQLVTATDAKERKTVKDLASEKTREAKERARKEWDHAMKQLRMPGRVHRLARYGEAQLPLHRQFIPAGTMYFAELEEPLDFGTVAMTVDQAFSLGTALPEGSVVHARLLTPLSSATASKGDKVEAVVSQPIMDGDRLILSEGSILRGTVRQAQRARLLKKNGQLRLGFSELVAPDGIGQKVVATLEGVQAGKDANVKLDSEGGAEATTSKSRYLATAFSVGLAAASLKEDEDAAGSLSGNTGGRMAGGAGGFKLVGMVVGALVHSRAFGYTTGAYGTGMSVYSHFITHGREVVFPRNTAMEIGTGMHTRPTGIPALAPSEHMPTD